MNWSKPSNGWRSSNEIGNGEWGVGKRNFFSPLPIPHSPFPTPYFISAANLEHFDVTFQVVAPLTRLSVIAAEDRASETLFPVVATETTAPPALSGGVVLFDCGRGRRVLDVCALNRMTGRAVHEFEVLGVRELGAERAALELGEVWLGPCGEPLRMADHAIVFDLRFFVEAARRVADVTFGVRGDGDGQILLGRLMAIVAFQFFAVGQFVFDVKFMLLGVEKRVKVVTLREVALRGARVQSLI